MSVFHPGSLKLTWMVAVLGECFVLALLHGCAGLSVPTQTHTRADNIPKYLLKVSSLTELSE